MKKLNDIVNGLLFVEELQALRPMILEDFGIKTPQEGSAGSSTQLQIQKHALIDKFFGVQSAETRRQIGTALGFSILVNTYRRMSNTHRALVSARCKLSESAWTSQEKRQALKACDEALAVASQGLSEAEHMLAQYLVGDDVDVK